MILRVYSTICSVDLSQEWSQVILPIILSFFGVFHSEGGVKQRGSPCPLHVALTDVPQTSDESDGLSKGGT